MDHKKLLRELRRLKKHGVTTIDLNSNVEELESEYERIQTESLERMMSTPEGLQFMKTLEWYSSDVIKVRPPAQKRK